MPDIFSQHRKMDAAIHPVMQTGGVGCRDRCPARTHAVTGDDDIMVMDEQQAASIKEGI